MRATKPNIAFSHTLHDSRGNEHYYDDQKQRGCTNRTRILRPEKLSTESVELSGERDDRGAPNRNGDAGDAQNYH